MERKHFGLVSLCLVLLLFLKCNVFGVAGDQDEDIPHNDFRMKH